MAERKSGHREEHRMAEVHVHHHHHHHGAAAPKKESARTRRKHEAEGGRKANRTLRRERKEGTEHRK